MHPFFLQNALHFYKEKRKNPKVEEEFCRFLLAMVKSKIRRNTPRRRNHRRLPQTLECQTRRQNTSRWNPKIKPLGIRPQRNKPSRLRIHRPRIRIRLRRSNIWKRPHLQLRPTNMERTPRKLRRQHSKKIQKQLHRTNQKHLQSTTITRHERMLHLFHR